MYCLITQFSGADNNCDMHDILGFLASDLWALNQKEVAVLIALWYFIDVRKNSVDGLFSSSVRYEYCN